MDGHEDALANPGKITLNHLPTDQTFRLRFFASQDGLDGELDRRTRFTANGQSVDLEAANNENQDANPLSYGRRQ